jgi:hypothetical protein
LVPRPLADAPLQAPIGESVIAPLTIEGLPVAIEALGRQWQRKVEFHMTVIGAPIIEGHQLPWQDVAALTAGRIVGPITPTRELRCVRHPDERSLQTLVVMVDCPALGALYAELSGALGARLIPPPAHVTLYSTDPQEGIGINDEAQLRERAPALSGQEQEELRRAMCFDEVFEPRTR